MTALVHTLYGWTLSQYAQAKALHARVDGTPLPKTVAGAMKLVHWWKSRRQDSPGDIRLVDVEPEMDFAWATSTYECALNEFYNSAYKPPDAARGEKIKEG